MMVGPFTIAGGVLVNGVARWDGENWWALGSGVEGHPRAVAALPGGDIVVGGDLSSAGGIPVSNIARWDGETWHAMGSGADYQVTALSILPSGDLAVGGAFFNAGGLPGTRRIAAWNEKGWYSLGGGVHDDSGVVHALLTMPSGALWVGGSFREMAGQSIWGVARWNGMSWSEVGGGIGRPSGSRSVLNLTRMPNGDVLAGGGFDRAGGVAVNDVARWDGSFWRPFDDGSGAEGGEVQTFLPLSDTTFIMGGRFHTVGGQPMRNIAVWNGSAWEPFSDEEAAGVVYAMAALPNKQLLIGAGFVRDGLLQSPYLARWGCPDSFCYADCDESGDLDFFDFLCYQFFFAAADPKADCDEDGAHTFFDLLCYQNLFAAGCP